jgi:histidine triad (HIT) family protein
MKRVKSLIARLCFMIARSRIGGTIIGWSFEHMCSFMPVNKLYETERVVAFHHPHPMHPIHILVVPKRAIQSFLALTEADMPFVNEAITIAQRIVKEYQLEQQGYRFVVNGGIYQEVKQIHFHLVSGGEDPCVAS